MLRKKTVLKLPFKLTLAGFVLLAGCMLLITSNAKTAIAQTDQAQTDQASEDLQQRVARLEKLVLELQSEIQMLKSQIGLANGLESPTAETEDSPAELLRAFLNPDADHAKLAQLLRPAKEDFDQLFTAEFAEAAFKIYDPAWDSDMVNIRPKSGQTELLLSHLNAEDIRQWNEKTDAVPGGYKSVRQYLKGDYEIYSFKFVKPGESLGMAYTGLIKVNGHWRLFPKLWRVPMPQ